MKQYSRQLPFLAASCLFASGLLAAAADTQAPNSDLAVEESRPQVSSQQHQHRRGPKRLVLSIADDAQVELWKPDLSKQPTEIRQGKVVFEGTGVDNYHAIVAKRIDGKLTETAIRYQYGRGQPSGHSSTELTAASKTTLEIVPDPIPREHYHYHSDQTWNFIVRFQGLPLANQRVTLKTANGSHLEATTTADGRVALHIPDDFPHIEAGERDKRSAEFSISSRYTEADQTYQSTLNAAYRVNPHHWHSSSLGVMVVGIGLLAGGFVGGIGRRKKNRGKQL